MAETPNLVKPRMKLVRNPGNVYGQESAFGYNRVWRPDEDWLRKNTEWIEPLGAVAPRGDNTATDMVLSDWSGDTGQFVEKDVPAAKTGTWLEHIDGAIYDNPPPVHEIEYANSVAPNLVAYLRRFCPPPGQSTGVSWELQLDGEARYSDGELDTGYDFTDVTVGIRIPTEKQGDVAAGREGRVAPSLVIYDISGSSGPVVLSENNANLAVRSEPTTEVWTIECAPPFSGDTGENGTHIVINSEVIYESWYVHTPLLRVSNNSTLTVVCQGCIYQFNVTELDYGGTATAYPPKAKPKPTGEHTDELAWESEVSGKTNAWNVSVSNTASNSTTTYCPKVTMEAPTGTVTRPYLWFVREDHDSELYSGEKIDESTEGQGIIRRLNWRLTSNWKQNRGSAEFYPSEAARLTSWQKDDVIEITGGWASHEGDIWAPAKLGIAYLTDVPRKRDAETAGGAPQVSVSFGDFVEARMGHHDALYDFPQAGGRTVFEWFTIAMHRLGLPDSMIDVASEITGIEIPLADVPSRPSYNPRDGASWRSHVDKVISDLTYNDRPLRWGQRITGEMFVEPIPNRNSEDDPVAYTIDEANLTVEDEFRTIKTESASPVKRNAYKGKIGPYNDADEDWGADGFEVREKDGVNRRVFLRVEDGVHNNIDDMYQEKYGVQERLLRWTGPLRPDLHPDDMIHVAHLSGVEVDDDTYWYILEHSMDIAPDTPDATSTFTARKIVQ